MKIRDASFSEDWQKGKVSFREKPSDRQKLEKVSKCGTNTALLPRSVEDQFPKRDNVHTHTLRYTTNVKIKVPLVRS